jgi:hypothetical protein
MPASVFHAFVVSLSFLYAEEIDNDEEIDGGDAVGVLVEKIQEARTLVTGDSKTDASRAAMPFSTVALEGTPHPDEPTNCERTARIDGVLRERSKSAGFEPDTKLDESDVACLMADIRRWCDANSVDYFHADRVAYQHYLEELPFAAGHTGTGS